jgi:NAD(P)-dependent dehydrogenase (short-subunit alcohol dehydrogenase family)
MANDLDGKVIIITGGSSGIGAAAARIFRSRGATVAITGRSPETARLAGEIGADYFLTDFTKLSDVRKLASELLEKYPRIDVLVNNVGGIMGARRVTEDGHEATFQVNHLSGFLLTALLQERLCESGATVINTSSMGNNFGQIELSDLENERGYSAMKAYGTAKLMNILHASELNRRYGDKIHAASFHPGPVATGFAREGEWFWKLVYETPLKNFFLISPEAGADTMVWLATGKPGVDWQPGQYYDKRKPGRKHRQASDAELAKRFFEASEKLVGLA